jgi:hydroxymethylglutaryl-CoA reductase
MAEKVAPHIEKWTGGKVYLKIVSNLADKRLVRAWGKVPKGVLGGKEVVDALFTPGLSLQQIHIELRYTLKE